MILCHTPRRAQKTPTIGWFFAIPWLLSLGAFAQSKPMVALEPEGILTLQQVVAVVQLGHPELQTFSFDLRVAAARRTYAGAWPNPEVGVDIQDALGTGTFGGIAQTQTTLQLSQLIELGDKSRARQDVATSAERQVALNFEVHRLKVLTDAVAKFAHVVADQHRLELARDALRLAESGLEIVQRRIQSGAASVVEEHRARIAVARNRVAQEHGEHELLSSRRRLAAMWGSTEPRFTSAQADFFARAPLPTFEHLAHRVDDNPELIRLAAELALRDARVVLANAEAVPNLSIYAGARRLQGPGEFAFMGGFAIPLPIFDRNDAAVAEAHVKREQLSHEVGASRLATLTTLYGAFQEINHTITELTTLDHETLPQAEALMRTIEDGFRLGRFSQMELVDAQRTLVEVRRERIDAAEEYHAYVAHLERLIGGPLEQQKALQPASATPTPGSENK